MEKPEARFKGSALLSALFIMTLVAIAATAMTLRMHLDIYRTNLTIDSDKRYLASQAVLFWAMDRLHDKKYPFFKLYPQGQVADYPKNLQNIYPGIVLNGQIFDLQAKFNLNNLRQNLSITRFIALLDQVLPDKNARERENLLASLRYWISPHDLDKGLDSEASAYLKEKPPYYPSHLPFKNLSELRLVNGVDAALYQKLSPFLTALPEPLPININTAPREVLYAIKPGITPEQIQEIIQARQEHGIVDPKVLANLSNKSGILADAVTIESKYFLVVSEARSENFNLVNFSVLKREKDKSGKVTVNLIDEGYS